MAPFVLGPPLHIKIRGLSTDERAEPQITHTSNGIPMPYATLREISQTPRDTYCLSHSVTLEQANSWRQAVEWRS